MLFDACAPINMHTETSHLSEARETACVCVYVCVCPAKSGLQKSKKAQLRFFQAGDTSTTLKDAKSMSLDLLRTMQWPVKHRPLVVILSESETAV